MLRAPPHESTNPDGWTLNMARFASRSPLEVQAYIATQNKIRYRYYQTSKKSVEQ